MARQRSTFGKLERDRAKQARAKAKQERRMSRATDQPEEEPAPPGPVHDESDVLSQLAELHEAFDDGRVSLEDFESRRDELRDRLQID